MGKCEGDPFADLRALTALMCEPPYVRANYRTADGLVSLTGPRMLEPDEWYERGKRKCKFGKMWSVANQPLMVVDGPTPPPCPASSSCPVP